MSQVFRLYYTSRCTDQQVINVYIQDSFGQVVQKSFSFQSERTKEDEEE
ncbi:MAG: TraQ conjugal transfer family protein [Dysgonamonadaceae bacterium]